jgi:hypothetical protein
MDNPLVLNGAKDLRGRACPRNQPTYKEVVSINRGGKVLLCTPVLSDDLLHGFRHDTLDFLRWDSPIRGLNFAD